MAVASIGAALNPLTIQVLVELGIQNPLRQCLLQVVKQAVLRKHFIPECVAVERPSKLIIDRHEAAGPTFRDLLNDIEFPVVILSRGVKACEV